MSIFDDAACLAWKADLQFWQAVAAIKAARNAGVIHSQDDCVEASKAGSAIADQFGIPGIMSDSFGRCACKYVFADGSAPDPPRSGDSTPFKWNGTTWVPVDGGGVRIAVGPDGLPWMVNSVGNIYHDEGHGWVQQPGGGRDIGVGADGSVWLIGGTEI